MDELDRKTRLLTINEAAQRAGVSRQTVYNWINRGTIRPVKTPGGRLRIPEDQLLIEGETKKHSPGMFRTRDISELEPVRIEQMGTREKYWFSSTQKNWYWEMDCDEFLFKAGREGTGENWAEKVSAELCGLLALPHAEYDLAVFKGGHGVITPNFVPSDSWLRHGNEMLGNYLRGYEQAKRYRQSSHTVEAIMAVLGKATVRLPIGWPNPGVLECAADVFVGYLMLDAWIGNQDRHHENWGLIVLPDGNAHLSPTFDHASSLGRNESDSTREKRLTTRDAGMSMDAYVLRARSALYRKRGDAGPLSTFDAFLEAGLTRPMASCFWLDKLDEVSDGDTSAILDRIPRGDMSDIAGRFAQTMLCINRRRLLEMRAQFRKGPGQWR